MRRSTTQRSAKIYDFLIKNTLARCTESRETTQVFISSLFECLLHFGVYPRVDTPAPLPEQLHGEDEERGGDGQAAAREGKQRLTEVEHLRG